MRTEHSTENNTNYANIWLNGATGNNNNNNNSNLYQNNNYKNSNQNNLKTNASK